MPRIYLPIPHITGNRISITGDKARYLTSVLRCKKGDDLVVFDGEGSCLKTRIVKTDRKEVGIEVLESFPCETDSPLHITLVQGILKGDKMDIVVQKTTELGVKEIVPCMTERCRVRVTRKLERWKKIAQEASRQSGRSAVPIIHAPIDLRSFLSLYSPREKIRGFVFYEEGGMSLSEASESMKRAMNQNDSDLNSVNPPIPPLVKGGKGGFKEDFTHGQCFDPRLIVKRKMGFKEHSTCAIVCAIGPEGGFMREEIALAEEQGLLVVSLGQRILRAETASIAAVALIQFLLGDLS